MNYEGWKSAFRLGFSQVQYGDWFLRVDRLLSMWFTWWDEVIRWDLQENKTAFGPGESFMMPCYAAILPKLTRSKGIRISMLNWKFSDWRSKVTKLLQLIRTRDLIWFCSLHSVSEALELYWSQRSECKYRCWRDEWLPDERKPGSQKLDDHMKERTGPFLSEKYANVIPYNLVLLWNKLHS